MARKWSIPTPFVTSARFQWLPCLYTDANGTYLWKWNASTAFPTPTASVNTSTITTLDHAAMAQYVDQSVNLSAIDLPFRACTDHTGFSNSGLGNIHTFADIVNTTKDLDRSGSSPDVSVPRGQPYRQADRNWRYAHLSLGEVHA